MWELARWRRVAPVPPTTCAAMRPPAEVSCFRSRYEAVDRDGSKWIEMAGGVPRGGAQRGAEFEPTAWRRMQAFMPTGALSMLPTRTPIHTMLRRWMDRDLQARILQIHQLQGYTDADWQGDLDDRKSTSGYIFTLAGGAISWCSRKQKSVALSSMEVEYIATSEAAKEGVWLREFLASLKVVESASPPVTIFCDNMAAIKISKDPKFHSKSKHIEGRYHYIRDVINRLKIIRMVYLPSTSMVADPLTKPLSQELFSKHVRDMGLHVID